MPWHLVHSLPRVQATHSLSLLPFFPFFFFTFWSVILVHSWYVSLRLGYIWLRRIGILRCIGIIVFLYLIDLLYGIKIHVCLKFCLFPLFFSLYWLFAWLMLNQEPRRIDWMVWLGIVIPWMHWSFSFFFSLFLFL